MFNKPINQTIKEKVETIHADAVKKAEQDFKTKVLNKVKNLEHFDAFKFIVSKKNRIEDLIKNNNYPYYVNNHNSKDRLLSQCASRHFLLNVDEFSILKEAIYLGKVSDLIKTRFNALIKQIPKFTFDDFLSFRECRYFNTYDNYYNIEREDFYQIFNWQTDKLVKVVSYDVELLVKNHQEYCAKIKEPLEFINEQIQILEEELKESLNEPKELKRILSKLYVFKGVDIDNYNDEMLLFNYSLFFNDRIYFRRIKPSTVSEVLTKLSSKTETLISNEFFIFYTLNVFLFWLKDLVLGKSIHESFKYPIWEDLLYQKIDEAEQEIQTKNLETYDYVNNPVNSKKKVRKYLRNEFEKQIDRYNKIENKEIFYLIKNENRNPLISDFKINALFNNEEEAYLKNLKEAYILQNISWDISLTFNEVFDSKTIYYNKNTTSHLMIFSLTNDMVLDKDLSIELDEAMDSFFKEMGNTSLPLDIHFYNHREKYSRIFEKCISRLQDVLDNAEPNNKVLYIQSRLKQLRHRELKFRNLIDRKSSFKDKVDKYPDLFKEFLSIEAEFIKETPIIESLSYLPEKSKISLDKKKIEKFDDLLSIEKQEFILKMFEELAITVDGYSVLTPKKIGAIRGVVEALREKKIIPPMGLYKLCVMFADKINATIKSELDASNTSEDYKKAAIEYIKNNPLH